MGHIDDALNRFIDNKELKIMILKGPWGVGKTYYWKNFIKKRLKEIKKNAYSYVSLFGVKDLDQVKSQIFSNLCLVDNKEMKKRVLDAIKPINKIIKNSSIPYISNCSGLSNSFEEKFISEIFICFDDIERKDDSLILKSFLGLANYLGEEKDCKVVLIFNEGKFEEEDTKALKKYREKIVHLELVFDPSVEVNFKLIFNHEKEGLLKTFKSLNCNNIRVMNRVKWNLDFFGKYYTSKIFLKEAFEKKITILTCLYYAHSEKIDVDDNLSNFYYTNYIKRDDEGAKKKINLLSQAGYIPEDFDTLILKLLKDGYCSDELIVTTLEAVENKYLHANIVEENRNMWNLYHGNFKLTQGEYIEKHSNFIKRHLKELSLYDIAMALEFFKSIDSNIDISETLDVAIDAVIDGKTSPKEMGLDRVNFSAETKEKILKKYYEKHDESYTLDEVFKKFAENLLTSSDVGRLLKNYNKDDFFEFFKLSENSELLDTIKNFLLIFDTTAGNENKEIVVRMKKSLKKISERSKLDRLRVHEIMGLEEKEMEQCETTGSDTEQENKGEGST
ncbi:MAG: KAP family NTPase [Candidatus Omnitrophica bacterium]|nr:KAP family NTPase [Candidatus Omnitrophota bacterium]